MTVSISSQPWPPVTVDPVAPHSASPEPGTKLPEHYAGCFGCGEQQPAGLHLRSTVGTGTHVYSRFEVTTAHQGAPGLAHGGLLACAFDEALGTAVGNLLHQPAVTGRLETDFRRPVPVGSTLYIDAALDGTAGRKIYAHAVGRLDAADGAVAVSAHALFVVVGYDHFSGNGDTGEYSRSRAENGRPDDEWDINP